MLGVAAVGVTAVLVILIIKMNSNSITPAANNIPQATGTPNQSATPNAGTENALTTSNEIAINEGVEHETISQATDGFDTTAISKLPALDNIALYEDNYNNIEMSVQIPVTWNYSNAVSYYEGLTIDCANDNISFDILLEYSGTPQKLVGETVDFVFDIGESSYCIKEDTYTRLICKIRDTFSIVFHIDYSKDDTGWYEQNEDLIFAVAKTLAFAEKPNEKVSSEVYYNDVPVSLFFDISIDIIGEFIGQPIDHTPTSCYYDDMRINYDEATWMITSIEANNLSAFTIDGVTLENTRQELIDALGSPTKEEWDGSGYEITFDQINYRLVITLGEPDSIAWRMYFITKSEPNKGNNEANITSDTQNSNVYYMRTAVQGAVLGSDATSTSTIYTYYKSCGACGYVSTLPETSGAAINSEFTCPKPNCRHRNKLIINVQIVNR